MNPAELTAFIGSITALITAIYGVIVVIMHVRSDHGTPPQIPLNPPAIPTPKAVDKPPTL